MGLVACAIQSHRSSLCLFSWILIKTSVNKPTACISVGLVQTGASALFLFFQFNMSDLEEELFLIRYTWSASLCPTSYVTVMKMMMTVMVTVMSSYHSEIIMGYFVFIDGQNGIYTYAHLIINI